MKGFIEDIGKVAGQNDAFRRVLYTAKHCQLVVMALKPKEEIGEEVYHLDQFFCVEEGTGEAVMTACAAPFKRALRLSFRPARSITSSTKEAFR